MSTINNVLAVNLNEITDADLEYYIKELNDERAARKQVIRQKAIEAFEKALANLREVGVEVYLDTCESIWVVTKENIYFN